MLRNTFTEWLLENPRGYVPTTLANYRRAGTVLCDYADQHGYAGPNGTTDLSQFTPALVRACRAWLMDPKREHPSSWKGGEGVAALVDKAAIRLAEWLQSQGLPVADFSRYKPVKQPQRVQKRLTYTEFADMEQAAMRRLLRPGTSKLLIARDMVLLGVCLNTWLRAHELCALDWSHVDVSTGIITAHTRKHGRYGLVTVWDDDEERGGEVIRSLKTYRDLWVQAYGDIDGPLFVSHYGNRLVPDTLRQIIARVCKDAGLESNRPPHAFRRGGFTEAYKDNPLTLPVLVQRMGWAPASTNMVETYTRGADLDLAVNTPLPLTSKAWRQKARTQPRSPTNAPPRTGAVAGKLRAPGRGW